MARETFDAWVPVEYAADAIQRPDIASAILANVKRVPMNSMSKVFPRSGAAHVTTVAKGSAYSEDSGTNDSVTLTAVKFALAFRIANEDLDDSLANIIELKKGEFLRSYAVTLDNACLGTTAAANGNTVPFTSLYRAVTQADSATGYTANANLIQSAASGAVTYDNLSALFGLAEASNWYDQNSQIVIAHPKFKTILRGLKDGQGRPIFVSGLAGTPDTLFDHPIKYSLGARTSATATDSPSGNPLICSVNPNYLMLGDRDGVTAKFDTSLGTLTDEAILAMRARNAFSVTVPGAHAVLEVMP